MSTKAIQADCDVKATNIILQGLPPEVYALVSNHKVAKETLGKNSILCKETFIDETGKRVKFVTDVKLVRDLHTTNIDQLHAYLGQHEFHANKSPQYGSPHQSQQYSTHQSSTPLLITYLSNDYQSSVHHNVYSPSSSIPQLEYAPTINQQPEFSQLDSDLIILVFQKGNDPIDAINHMMSFLTAVVTSRYPTTNNQLRNSSNPRQKTYTSGASGSNSGKQRTIICYNCKGEGHMSKQCTKPKRKWDDSWFKDKVLLVQAQGSDALAEVHNLDNVDNNMINQAMQLERYKEQVKVLKKGQNVDLRSNNNVLDSSAQSIEIDRLKQTLSEHLKEKESLIQTVTLLKNDFKKEESRNIDREIEFEKKIKQLDNIIFKRYQSAQTVHMLTKPQFFYDHTTKQALCFQNPIYLKKAQQLEPNLYDGNFIKNTSAIVIPDSEETLMLAEESRSKMLLKQKDPMMLEKKVNTTPDDYAILNQLSQDFET
ncbi:retrovirus-related pol polyprotein from transposon TNT 1-94 [Tanacetum coccineum]